MWYCHSGGMSHRCKQKTMSTLTRTNINRKLVWRFRPTIKWLLCIFFSREKVFPYWQLYNRIEYLQLKRHPAALVLQLNSEKPSPNYIVGVKRSSWFQWMSFMKRLVGQTTNRCIHRQEQGGEPFYKIIPSCAASPVCVWTHDAKGDWIEVT